MRRLFIIAVFVLAAALPAFARNSIQGWCESGAQNVVTSGLSSTTQVQASYPKCNITVFVHGGTTLATIYSDNNGTPLSSTFESQINGHWQFYANDGRYDVTMTASPDQPFMPTTTYSDIEICDFLAAGSPCAGGGTGGPVNWYYNNSLIAAQPGGDFDDKLAGGTNVSIAATNDAANSRVHYVFSSVEQFQNAGVAVGAEPILNLIAGSNVTLSPFIDDTVNKRVSVTVNSSGGAGGTPNQSVAFTNQTSVTLTTTFAANTPLLTGCYDNASPANRIDPANTTVSSSSVVVWTFTLAQSGTCVVNGSSGGGGGGGGAVSSVFGRTGAVIAQSGDYSFSLLSGTATEAQLPATTVFTDKSATFGAFTYDFSAATVKLPSAASFTTGGTGQIGFDTAAVNWHVFAGSADKLMGVWSASPSNGGCVQASIVGGFVALTTPSSAGCNSTGANTALSNLAAVAINTGLLPASGGSIPLGSSALDFSTAFLGSAANKAVQLDPSLLSANRDDKFPDIAGTFGVISTASPVSGDGTQFLVTSGVVSLVDAGAPFALNTLSNLGVTSINADLLPNAAGTINLGSVSLPFNTVFANQFKATGVGTGYTTGNGGTCSLAGTIVGAGLYSFCLGDSTNQTIDSSYNGGGWLAVPQRVAFGTAALGTGAISSGNCATAVTVVATGVATTDVVLFSLSATATGYTSATGSGLHVLAVPTSGNVNFYVCNPTAGSITPGAETLNWRVDR